MGNDNVYDYQNEVLNNNESFQDFAIINEEFSYLNHDLLCKTIIYGMLFYILVNPVMKYYLKKVNLLDVEIMQTLLFIICYYIINLYL